MAIAPVVRIAPPRHFALYYCFVWFNLAAIELWVTSNIVWNINRNRVLRREATIVVNALDSWTVTLDARFSVLNYIDTYFSLCKKKMLSRSVATTISCTFRSCVHFTVKKISFRLDGISLILPIYTVEWSEWLSTKFSS